jgi:hypothetical protein
MFRCETACEHRVTAVIGFLLLFLPIIVLIMAVTPIRQQLWSHQLLTPH